jgi:uncharacterized protein (TIGR03000 family)
VEKEKAMRSFLLTVALGVGFLGLGLQPSPAVAAETAPAAVCVHLPADARLTFDGEATRSTASERRFVTPLLEAGKSYRYTLRATFVRGGNVVNVERQVVVEAGQETEVSLFAGEEIGGASSVGAAGTARRSYYYAPQPAAPREPESYSVPLSDSTGFHPTYWGTNPSDPFYLNTTW